MTQKETTSIADLQTAITHANIRITEVLKQFRETTGVDVTRVDLVILDARVPSSGPILIRAECSVNINEKA